MPTARKRATVKDMQQLFNSSQVLIFTEYRGLKVSDLTNLRRQLREKGVEYHIAKNTLTELAAKRAGFEQMTEMLGGPIAIAFVHDDIPGATKVLNDFVRTSRILVIRGGLAGRTVLTADQVGDLTKMLTREQYIAQALGTMQAPIRNFVTVLSGTLRGFMNVMQARVDQLKEQGDTSEAATEAESTETASREEATMSTEAMGLTAEVASGDASEAPAEVATDGADTAETTEAAPAQEPEAMPTEAGDAEATSDTIESATTEVSDSETSTDQP